jgi:Gpi18-like mannosyltransferase
MNKNVIKIFLTWLIPLLIIGFFSTHLSIFKGSTCAVKNQLPFYRWDSFWYTFISRHGYTFSEIKNSSIAFFPFYPMVIKVAKSISGIRPDYISFILNIAFSFFATSYLYRLAKMDYSEKTSLAIVLVFLFFPPTYFFLAGYPDALFALLAILSLYFSRRKQWAKAGIAAGLLAITKPYGIFMLPVVVIEYLWSHDWDVKIFFKKRDWLPLLLPLFSFGGFILFNYLKFGTPIAFLKAQQTWGRSLDNPLLALFNEAKHYLFSGSILSGSNFPYIIYLASFIFSIIAFILCWKRVRKSYLLFSLLLLLSAFLTGTLTSWGRYMLLGFPVLFGPAVYLSEKRRLFFAYLAISFFVMIFCASFFVRCFPFE